MAQTREQRDTTFQVSTVIEDSCRVVATPMAFGAYVGAVRTTTSTLTVTCTTGAFYNVGLSAGMGAGATVTSRRMTSGANLLGYGLFQDSGYTRNWGMAVGTDTVDGVGSARPQALTVYGRIPPGQAASAGSYADTITVTVTY
jgi:spore coat protein U-like protein